MKNGTFSTADLGQAAFLMAVGHRLLGIERTGQGRVAFRFADTEDRTATDSALEFANNAPAPAKALLEAMRFLRGALKDVRTDSKVQSEGERCVRRFEHPG